MWGEDDSTGDKQGTVYCLVGMNTVYDTYHAVA